jgi:dTDP-glucose 4,6-dehydratase
LLKTALDAWRATATLGSARFLHVSTDEVYGSLGPTDPAFTESSAYRPNSPYAASKASSDHLVRAFMTTYGVPALITNCSNNYGSYQHPEKLIPLMIIHALEGKPLPIYGDGSNIRDWLHVSDHCEALMNVIERGRTGETYNVGGGNERNNRDVVGLICDSIDRAFSEDTELAARFPSCPAASGRTSRTLISYVTDRPGHDHRYAINATKLATELGIGCRVGFESGLAQTVRWYLDHETWWRDVTSGAYKAWIDKNYGYRIAV